VKLLERKAPLDVLMSALRAASSGEGKLVIVSGEAGIGKTALVEYFLREQHIGLRTASGCCEPLRAARPLAPFQEIARQLGGSILAFFDGHIAQQRALPELLESFARRPTILVLEDVHWADDASIDVIRFLGRRIQTLPLLLVVTHRDDELEHAHPLRGMLASLATSPAIQRIALERLSTDAVRQLADAGSFDADDIYRRTEGNPFLVAEILSGGDIRTVPTAVRDLTVDRMARLSPDARRIAQIAAVSGRPEATLLRILSPGTPELTQACIEIGLFREDGGTVAFRHDLVRQAVLETIGPPLLLELHAEVFEALVSTRAADPARLAHHAHGACNADAVVAYAPVAARQATASGSHREAAAQYALALEYVGPESLSDRAALLVDYAAECAAVDRLSQAIESLEEAVSINRTLGDRHAEGAALAALALPLVRSGLNQEADERSRQAIALLDAEGPSQQQAVALRTQAQLRMLDRDKAQALHFGRRAIVMAEGLDDIRTVATASMTVGTALLVADQPEGRPYLDRAMHLARSAGFDELLAHAYLNLGSSYGEQYHFTDAERFLTEGIAFASERDLDQHLHYMQAWLALVHLHRGRLREASEAALRLLANENVAAVSRIMALVAVGRARARLGEEGCNQFLDEALALATPTGTLQRLAPVRMARAEAAWLAGNPQLAREEANAARQLAMSHRHKWHAGEVAFWLAPSTDTEPAPRWIARPFALHLEGDWSAAAEAWCSLGCPYEEARALASGDEQAQLAALGIFGELDAAPAAALLRQRMRRSGSRHLPRGPRPRTRLNMFGLTARQSDILSLLAEGQTNAAIARRLMISTKTVDHHVSAILGRLNVASRKEAAGKFHERTIAPRVR
jgi:DNA-binding CsgD family transcriptional regulator/tetratricopeptide (TPR) repeat protein